MISFLVNRGIIQNSISLVNQVRDSEAPVNSTFVKLTELFILIGKNRFTERKDKDIPFAGSFPKWLVPDLLHGCSVPRL